MKKEKKDAEDPDVADSAEEVLHQSQLKRVTR
jgi:hypothetical protein